MWKEFRWESNCKTQGQLKTVVNQKLGVASTLSETACIKKEKKFSGLQVSPDSHVIQ